MGSVQKSGPIRTVFNNICPWAKTCLFNKFLQNISKVAACRFNKNTPVSGQTDARRLDKRRSIQKMITTKPSMSWCILLAFSSHFGNLQYRFMQSVRSSVSRSSFVELLGILRTNIGRRNLANVFLISAESESDFVWTNLPCELLWAKI